MPGSFSRVFGPVAFALVLAAASACASSHHAASPVRDDAGDAQKSDAEHFSFFVTSLRAMQELSGNELGFGGDLRFGEDGPGAGLRGADKICTAIAGRSMESAAKKKWRAFLSATAGEDGNQVNAIDRIGDGPWYDRLGRLVAARKADLMHDRPQGADSAIAHDFPNEDGVPNQKPDPTADAVDNHDILTGTNTDGALFSATATCLDWTSALGDPDSEGRPHVGHSWDRMDASLRAGLPTTPPPFDGGIPFFGDGGPIFGGMVLPPPDGAPPPFGGMRTGDGGGFVSGGPPPGFGSTTGGPAADGSSGSSWMSVLDEAGCAAGINLVQNGPPDDRNPTVGSGGGYGAIYCFALSP